MTKYEAKGEFAGIRIIWEERGPQRNKSAVCCWTTLVTPGVSIAMGTSIYGPSTLGASRQLQGGREVPLEGGSGAFGGSVGTSRFTIDGGQKSIA